MAPEIDNSPTVPRPILHRTLPPGWVASGRLEYSLEFGCIVERIYPPGTVVYTMRRNQNDRTDGGASRG